MSYVDDLLTTGFDEDNELINEEAMNAAIEDIISNGSKTLINSKKIPAMTVGGTGDVLSGITASMLSRNRNMIEAAASAAFLNGETGKIVQKQFGIHMLASDLINALPLSAKTFDRIK